MTTDDRMRLLYLRSKVGYFEDIYELTHSEYAEYKDLIYKESIESHLNTVDDVDLPLPSFIECLKRDCIKNRRNYLGER